MSSHDDGNLEASSGEPTHEILLISMSIDHTQAEHRV